MEPSKHSPAKQFTLVTKSYLPDLARCELLVESAQRCSPGLKHHLIIDHRDIPHFRHLADRATIITSEDLLPWWVKQVPGRRSVWLSLRSRPTRGWIMQQVLKIAAASQIGADVSVFCDSGVAFIRPFSTSQIIAGESVALLDVEFVNEEVQRRTTVAAALLGLDAATLPMRGHVGNLICWRQENVAAMISRIETVSGVDWRVALMRQPTFSEYILYGVHTRAVLGYDSSGQHPSAAPLVKVSWGVDMHDETAFDEFFTSFEPATVAVMVHSKDGIDPARYRRRLEGIWATGS